MAEIIGQSGSDILVKMSLGETKKVFAEPNPVAGMVKNIHPVYNQLVWLMNNKAKLIALIDAMRNGADNLEAAINLAGV